MSRCEWTPADDDQLRRLSKSGLTDGEIGERMGRGKDAVRYRREKLGIQTSITPALVMMMHRVNAQRRFRLQKA